MVKLSAMRIGSVRYNSPWTQMAVLGFVTFCSVGMFSAVSGLGAGGLQDVSLSDTASSVLYGCFAVAGFFAGSVNNILGPRLTLSMGTVGYPIYIGGLWAYQVHGTRWFLILSGTILGVTAALLWAAQGAIMMAYPMENEKGRSFTVFWSLFQLGTLTGAAMALGFEFDSDLPSVSTGVYLAFMVIMLTAVVTSWLVLPPHLVVRGDGTVPKLEDYIAPRREMAEFAQLFRDWRMVALLPMFFSSNYFYAYQGAITAHLFNGRTRALVSLLVSLGSIFGSVLIGVLTDRLPGTRRTRALLATLFVLLLNCLVWASGLVFQLLFTRADTRVKGAAIPWDWTGTASAGPIVLLTAYYVADACYQGLAYYTMSAISNDPFRLARMAGYYKGVQSAGAAVSFAMDAVKTSYLCEILVSWLMLVVALPLCILVLWHTRVDTNHLAEETVRVDNKAKPAVPEGPQVDGGDKEAAVEVKTEPL